MNCMRHSFRCMSGRLTTLSLVAVLVVAVPAVAQRGTADQSLQSRQSVLKQGHDARSADSGLDNLWHMLRSRDRNTPFATRNAPAVLAAFHDVVTGPRESTVQVLSDREQVALGVIVRADGYVLTKSSEVKEPVVCRLSDGSVYAARVVNRDRATDLAMLHIAAKGIAPITWADKETITPGHWVTSVGISRLPIAIGVVSTRTHRVRGGMLGIIPGEGIRGALIQHVVRGGGADKAGLLVGDTITQIDGATVRSPDQLIACLATIPPDQDVRVTILRGDQTRNITVRLGSGHENDEQAKLQEKLAGSLSDRRVGFAAVFEHDTVLQPAQCGGPLVDVDGNAVGINIARASRVASFALPADVVQDLVPKLMREATQPVSRKSSDNTLLKPVLPPSAGARN